MAQFFSLPPEIRVQIYGLVFPPILGVKFAPPYQELPALHLPAPEFGIIYACKADISRSNSNPILQQNVRSRLWSKKIYKRTDFTI